MVFDLHIAFLVRMDHDFLAMEERLHGDEVLTNARKSDAVFAGDRGLSEGHAVKR